jgi:hypothetical protein
MQAARHALARQLRAHGPQLLAAADDPHEELLTLVWGPRFDRHHGLGLLLRQPRPAPASTLPALLAAADLFDELPPPAQHRLRRLILRHRAISGTAHLAHSGENQPPCPAPRFC